MEFTGKKLVVFGCGYVGTEFARQAIGQGIRVTALTRNGTTARALRQIGAEVVVADLSSDEWHGTVPASPDFALNTVSSGGGGLEGYRQSYLLGMRSILRWVRARAPVGTFVYTSSTSVYPQGAGALIDEQADTNGTAERAQILIAAENAVREGRTSDSKIDSSPSVAWQRWFILRLAGIYGPSRHHLVEQVKQGVISGSGETHLNLVQRDDVCSAIWAVMRAPEEIADEVFNVADDYSERKSVVANWLAAKLSVPAPVFNGLPAGSRRELTPDRVISNAKAKRLLDWAPAFPSFREGYENILSRDAE